ncbi:hypothetical protein SERLA73DRAFT_66187, partial [Serpula lacrymans var. lacrymans S7.3]
NPIKTFASWILSIVPYTTKVKQLFSDFNGIQGAKQCNLMINNFKTFGKL